MDKFLGIYYLMQFIFNVLQLVGGVYFEVGLMNPHWLWMRPGYLFKCLCVFYSTGDRQILHSYLIRKGVFETVDRRWRGMAEELGGSQKGYVSGSRRLE